MWPMQEVRACSCDSSMGWQQVWCLILCQPDCTTGYSDLAKHILGVSLRTFLGKINIWICTLSKASRLPSPKWVGLFLSTEQKDWVRGNFYLIAWAVTLLFSGLQTPPETLALLGSQVCWFCGWNVHHQLSWFSDIRMQLELHIQACLGLQQQSQSWEPIPCNKL